MQNRLIAIAAIFLLLAGCKSTPKGILTEEKMVAVFADIHVAEGRLKTVGIFGDSAKKMAPVLYDQVYKTHLTTREEFIASYKYYQGQPEKFEKIMEKVITEVSKKESGIK
jgi:hypothetical protein